MSRETVNEMKKKIYESMAEENFSMEELEDAVEAANEFLEENPKMLANLKKILGTLGLPR